MSLRTEFESFIGAVRFFTRLSVPGRDAHSPVALERAIRYFPAIGLLVGAIAALAFILASVLWPKTLAVLAAIIVATLLTGALHEDGWSDTVDGFGGGWGKERILAIMRDSCIGSFGAVALVLLALTRFCALVEIDNWQLPCALIAGHALSRLCATYVLSRLDYARPDGKAKAFGNCLSSSELGGATLCALIPLFFLPLQQTIPGVILAILATGWLMQLFKREIGGYTGDTLGAIQQLSEVAFYCGLLCRFS